MFKNFDFIGHKKIWFTFSGIMILLSIISIILFRFNWGIDFTGGTILELGFNKNVTVEEVRDGLREDGLQTSTIQLSGNISGESGDDVIIRTRNLSSEEAQTVVAHVNDKVGGAEVKRIETVGAVIGSEVTKSTLLNVLISFGAMILYMSIRFEHRIAISAIVAICHDILMVLGVFAFFHLEVDASFLAAILTVLGYSMNESVVIFDRIRENLHTHRRTDSFATLANDSIHQTIRRSLYTLTTTLFCVASLYFFGGDTTKNFALVMLIGFISGAYSSICVASSIWVTWHEHLHSERNEKRGTEKKLKTVKA
ncbi:protein translocase subunit SecF [uncultured Dialister sp.]|jgi:preprotein translocase subunit SecF|uniref:protein translocase subunit SecF n=1 Tax=uncultured Dialister sp. TaxID=278064 RepID=UPI0025E90DDD|nr:protein translocase subunit SecF [uncultured Dialister sp.]